MKIDSLSVNLQSIVVTGDFNFPTINWNSLENKEPRSETKEQANILLKFADKYCLSQYIKKPTRGNNIPVVMKFEHTGTI